MWCEGCTSTVNIVDVCGGLELLVNQVNHKGFIVLIIKQLLSYRLTTLD